MSYVVLSSEKLRTTASDTETKALLYLMNFHKDSDNIYYYIVDFYNDLTGMDRFSNNMWDLQSKGNKKSYPKEIGRELVTLLKNYISEFKFNSYVLFLEGVTSSLRIDQTKNVFGIENITDKSKKSIIKGLVEESKLKTYIPNDILNEEIIGQFLDEVTFVVDTKTKADYIKEIISNHPQIIPDEEDLVAIFNEIRDKQASKKNIMSVENVVVNSPDEALNYYRHLTNDEIRLMVISRIINRNPLDKGIPLSFLSSFGELSPRTKKALIDGCQSSFCRALFNKNAAQSFWELFNEIYTIIVNKPDYTIEDIYRSINQDVVKACPDFDVLSIKYFISVVKDGVEDGN